MTKFLKVSGMVVRFALAGVLILSHIIMDCVGILVIAITSQN